MLIIFDNWHISAKLSAPTVQNDNLSVRLSVEGELPEGFSSWSLLMRANGGENVVALEDTDGKPGITLTGDMLPYGDTFYELQLRGECDELVKHSDITSVYISGAISGNGSWPESPGEFAQAEARIRELNAHPPVPDEDGEYWAVWDLVSHEYVTSEYPLPAGGAATAPVRGTDYWTDEDIASIKSYVDDLISGGEW